jgi:ABC-2 type transport system permease protein
VRTAFGIGRGFKAKLFPFAVVGIVVAVAVVITAVSSQAGRQVVTYFSYVDVMGTLAVLFLAVVAPELVSRDLRARLLTLYFSRALGRTDYALGKLAALVTAVWLLLGAPQLLMFAGAAFDAKHPHQVWDQFTQLLGGVLYAGIFAVITSAVALLVASFSGRRAFAAGGIMAVFLVTLPVVGVLAAVGGDGPLTDLAGVANPSTLAAGVSTWVFQRDDGPPIGSTGPLYVLVAVVLVAVCTVGLLARYRRVES